MATLKIKRYSPIARGQYVSLRKLRYMSNQSKERQYQRVFEGSVPDSASREENW